LRVKGPPGRCAQLNRSPMERQRGKVGFAKADEIVKD
jgi:hypothetical protein